jgi:hypothetical protein
MSLAPLRVKDKLDGASNFLSWKERVILALNEYDLWDLVDKVVVLPIDIVALESHNKKEIKEERVILDSMKDHLIPDMSKNNMAKYMFDALVGLFHSTNMNRKMVLRTPHLQPYTIGWLCQGRDLCVNQQCRLPYNIKPFKDEVLCDIYPLEVCDVLLGQSYLWKRHVVYESRPHSVIITLGRQLYRIPKVALPTAISLILAKQCSKVIS